MTAGVYAIRNTNTGRLYVGSSIGIEQRWTEHRAILRRNSQTRPIQADWNRYGEESFALIILETIPSVSRDALNVAEQRWIDRFIATAPVMLYNVNLKAARHPIPRPSMRKWT